MAMKETDVETTVVTLCDGCEGQAVATLVMLKTDSLDGISFVCRDCLLDFWSGWVDDPERCAWEVQTL